MVVSLKLHKSVGVGCLTMQAPVAAPTPAPAAIITVVVETRHGVS